MHANTHTHTPLKPHHNHLHTDLALRSPNSGNSLGSHPPCPTRSPKTEWAEKCLWLKRHRERLVSSIAEHSTMWALKGGKSGHREKAVLPNPQISCWEGSCASFFTIALTKNISFAFNINRYTTCVSSFLVHICPQFNINFTWASYYIK